MKQRELMERMNIQAGSLSEIIAKVEAGGFLERTRCEGDRRNFELRLTDAGRERAEIFERERDEMAQKLFSVLDDAQKDELFETLNILLEKWRGDLWHCHVNSGESQDNAADSKKESESNNA